MAAGRASSVLHGWPCSHRCAPRAALLLGCNGQFISFVHFLQLNSIVQHSLSPTSRHAETQTCSKICHFRKYPQPPPPPPPTYFPVDPAGLQQTASFHLFTSNICSSSTLHLNFTSLHHIPLKPKCPVIIFFRFPGHFRKHHPLATPSSPPPLSPVACSMCSGTERPAAECCRLCELIELAGSNMSMCEFPAKTNLHL